MELTRETVREYRHGWQTVGVERIQLTPLDLYALKGILLTAPGSTYPDGGNTKPIWVGGNRVTADENHGTGGIPLVPGASMFIPLDKPDHLWLISTEAGQKVSWMIV